MRSGHDSHCNNRDTIDVSAGTSPSTTAAGPLAGGCAPVEGGEGRPTARWRRAPGRPAVGGRRGGVSLREVGRGGEATWAEGGALPSRALPMATSRFQLQDASSAVANSSSVCWVTAMNWRTISARRSAANSALAIAAGSLSSKRWWRFSGRCDGCCSSSEAKVTCPGVISLWARHKKVTVSSKPSVKMQSSAPPHRELAACQMEVGVLPRVCNSPPDVWHVTTPTLCLTMSPGWEGPHTCR